MLSDKYAGMLNQTSVIRDMFYFACDRAEKYGSDNVFDYSIGNPSVPVPREYNETIKDLLDDPDLF